MALKKNDIGVSSSGSRIYQPVDYEYSEKLKMIVPVFKKKLDRYKMIQASKNATDIAAIVKRAAAGDISVLNVHQGFYGDFSDVPDNLNDMHQLNIEAINSWSKLDPNIRKLFNNDYDQFAEAVSNGSYVNVINEALKVKTDDKPQESEGDK